MPSASVHHQRSCLPVKPGRSAHSASQHHQRVAVVEDLGRDERGEDQADHAARLRHRPAEHVDLEGLEEVLQPVPEHDHHERAHGDLVPVAVDAFHERPGRADRRVRHHSLSRPLSVPSRRVSVPRQMIDQRNDREQPTTPPRTSPLASGRRRRLVLRRPADAHRRQRQDDAGEGRHREADGVACGHRKRFWRKGLVSARAERRRSAQRRIVASPGRPVNNRFRLVARTARSGRPGWRPRQRAAAPARRRGRARCGCRS